MLPGCSRPRNVTATPAGRCTGAKALEAAAGSFVGDKLSANMDDFEFVPDPNAHLSVMGDIALRISELFLARPWWIAHSPPQATGD